MLAAGWQVAQPPKYRTLIRISSLLSCASRTWLQIPLIRGVFKTHRLLGLAQARTPIALAPNNYCYGDQRPTQHAGSIFPALPAARRGGGELPSHPQPGPSLTHWLFLRTITLFSFLVSGFPPVQMHGTKATP